jgi:hypothetical protein
LDDSKPISNYSSRRSMIASLPARLMGSSPCPFTVIAAFADQAGRSPHLSFLAALKTGDRPPAKEFYAPIPRPSNARERIAMTGRLDSAELARENGV